MPAQPAPDSLAAVTARTVMRGVDVASLATRLAGADWPYASLVLVALDYDASPILLISRLAEHTRNILADDRVSLLFDATHGLDSRLTGARVTVLGYARPSADGTLIRRFVDRHPAAIAYASFADFSFYRVAVTRAHLVAGFGQIHWLEGDALQLGLPANLTLAEEERAIVEHMNADHLDTIQLYAQTLLGAAGQDWRMTGCDPEGADLRQAGQVLRLSFAKRAENAEAARVELVRLAKQARTKAAGAA
jgi:putative heme iron utilization protein